MPVVFLGSSSEARRQAEIVKSNLAHDAYVVPWWKAPEFGGLAGTLEALMEALKRYDFAVFLLTPDDKTESRGTKQVSARDNVLFEAGLFLGVLGRERVEILVQRNSDAKKRVKIPSDLLGVALPGYEMTSEIALDSTIDDALTNFRQRIRNHGKYIPHLRLAKSWHYDPKAREFSMTLGEAHLKNSHERLTGMALFIAVRKGDPKKDPQNDKDIFLSELRHPSMDRDLTISVTIPSTVGIRKNDEIECYLFAAPAGFKFTKVKCMADLHSAGAESIDGKATTVR